MVSDKVEAKVAGVFASGEGSQAKSEDKYADKLPEESRGQKRTEGERRAGKGVAHMRAHTQILTMMMRRTTMIDLRI